MEPLATYADKSPFEIRSYQLFPDRIVVRHNNTVSVEAESVFGLRDLGPEHDTIRVRSPFLTAGVWIALVAGLIYWALIELTHQDSLGTFPGFFLMLGFVGLLMIALGLKKQRLVRFKTKAGVPAFDIFQEGPRKREFDGFIVRLQTEIRAADLNQ